MAKTFATPYSPKNRRNEYYLPEQLPATTRFNTEHKAFPAPAPEVPPGPWGDMSHLSLEELIEFIATMSAESAGVRSKRRRAMELLGGHLVGFPGDTWQERWDNSDLSGEEAVAARSLSAAATRHEGNMLTVGVKLMFCLRIIKPALGEFRVNKFNQYPILFQALSKDPLLDTYFAAVQAHSEIGFTHRFRALFDVACALTTQGIELADLTPSALLFYSTECKRLGVSVGASKDHSRFSALMAWKVLCEIGHFPPDTPPTLRATSTRVRSRSNSSSTGTSSGTPGSAS